MAPQASSNEAHPELVALFVSDLHLQPTMPRTAEAFSGFLRQQAIRARELYLLGDLFEYWAGDDDLSAPFNKQVVQTIRETGDTGVTVFWMAGNRDFLIGEEFARAAGIRLLSDPHVAAIAGRRIVLAHGDAQCTDDVGYMQFRSQVREASWQKTFLAMPLAQRKMIIAGLRNNSREAQRSKPDDIMDVSPEAITALFTATGADAMIHGHTHRPARHQHEGGRMRYVLPDWDCDAATPRGGWIGIAADGSIRRFGFDGTELP
jgi:UDP-2,3-diacylglucosamine hydrolase